MTESRGNDIYRRYKATRVRRECTHIHALGIPENFIRFITEFEVEPAKLSVVATDDQVVPRWMNVHRGNPPYTRNKHFQELLLCKVIDPYITLRLRDSRQFPGDERGRGSQMHGPPQRSEAWKGGIERAGQSP